MKIEELVRHIAQYPSTALVLTATDLDAPGPTITFVNDAFCSMVGRPADELVGRSPRMLQGKSTNRTTLTRLGSALRKGGAHRDVVVNYRANGEPYYCGFEIYPVFNRCGVIECYAAFEAEMIRRRGRPSPGAFGRFSKLDQQVVLPGEISADRSATALETGH